MNRKKICLPIVAMLVLFDSSGRSRTFHTISTEYTHDQLIARFHFSIRKLLQLPTIIDISTMAEDHRDNPDGQIDERPYLASNGAASFKTNLEKFRHVSDADGPSTRSSNRKRRLDEVQDDDVPAKSPSPAKKKRRQSGYTPPEKYAHLPKLNDILEPNLIGVFVGFNPGVRTATAGHAYAHPSNMFWKLLHSSGITDVRLRPEQDVDLPRLYSMGNTNLVDRPSKDAGELSKQEMAAGTPILEEKVRTFRPEAVCIVGKSIWQAMWRWKYKREIKKDEFRYGWQDDEETLGKEGDWPGAWVFVATATSGLAANLKPHEKEAIWRPFGEWVQKRREERTQEVEAGE